MGEIGLTLETGGMSAFDAYAAGRELDTAISLTFPELNPQFVRMAFSDSSSIQSGGPSSYDECVKGCAEEEPWAGQSFKPVAVTRYSQDIAAAWQVVEAMKAKGYEFNISLEIWSKGMPDVPYQAWFRNREQDAKDEWCGADAETAPEAICKAALKATAASTVPARDAETSALV